MLNNIDRNKIYLNVKIINIINNEFNNLLYTYKNIDNLDKFYKVTNLSISIIPNILSLNFRDGRFKLYKSYRIDDIFIKYFDEEIIYYIAPNTNISNKLIDKWWFKIIDSTPPCVRGRFIQSSGTCWMNTILNILIMSIPIRNRMIEIWKREWDKERDYKFKIPFNKFNDENNFKNIRLKYYIYSIIYNLFINHTRSISTDGNIIAPIAAKLQSIFECNEVNDNHNECNKLLTEKIITTKEDYSNIQYNKGNLEYGDGGRISSIKYLFNEYFDENDFYILDYNNLNNYRNKIVIQYNAASWDDQQQIKPILNRATDLKNDFINIVYGKKNKITIDQFNNSNIVIFTTFENNKNINEYIYINAIKYKIHACCINISGSHAVAGITCNNERYVYDSNNFISKDNWLNNIDNYIKMVIQLYKNITSWTIDCIIYLKENY